MRASNAEGLLLVLRQQRSRYAISATQVEEIIGMPAITPLPLQPEYMRGIFNYKGHAVPAFSLRALCGGSGGEDEDVCAVLHLDDELVALTADAAESLVKDDGRRMKCAEGLLEGKLIKLDYVLSGDPAIFVLNLEKVCGAIESDLN